MMFKNLSKSLILSLLLAVSLVASVQATDDVEGDNSSKSSPRTKLTGLAKSAAAKLPSSHLTLAVASEFATEFCPTAVTTAVSQFSTLTGVDSALSSLADVPYVGTAASSLNSATSPIYKVALEETAFFGGHLVNRLVGNTKKALTWTETGTHMVRGGAAVAAIHYVAPVIETYGVQLVNTYVSTSLSNAAQSVGIPLTQEMVESAAPYILKASLFLGVEGFKWGVSAFSSSFLKSNAKKKKD